MKTIFMAPEEFMETVVLNKDLKGAMFLERYKIIDKDITYLNFYHTLECAINQFLLDRCHDDIKEKYKDSLESFGSWVMVTFYGDLYTALQDPSEFSSEYFDLVESTHKVKHADIFKILTTIHELPNDVDEMEFDSIMIRFLMMMSINYFTTKYCLNFGMNQLNVNSLQNLITEAALSYLGEVHIPEDIHAHIVSDKHMAVLFEISSSIFALMKTNDGKIIKRFFMEVEEGENNELSENS